jgi:hypothetical protein
MGDMAAGLVLSMGQSAESAAGHKAIGRAGLSRRV